MSTPEIKFPEGQTPKQKIAAKPLKHHYYSLRHGFSVPNERRVIVSSLTEGCRPEYGLALKGKRQAEVAGEQLYWHVKAHASEWFSIDRVLFITSPFTRAMETAQIASGTFFETAKKKLDPSSRIVVQSDLRERFFGAKEGLTDEEYHSVWKEDVKNADHHVFGVESVAQVWNRVSAVLQHCEKSLKGGSWLVVLVSHGDTLQITQTGVSGYPVQFHRSMPHLNQCEFRHLTPMWNKRVKPTSKL